MHKQKRKGKRRRFSGESAPTLRPCLIVGLLDCSIVRLRLLYTSGDNARYDNTIKLRDEHIYVCIHVLKNTSRCQQMSGVVPTNSA